MKNLYSGPLLLLISTLLLLSGCDGSDKTNPEGPKERHDIERFLETGNFQKADSMSRLLLVRSCENQDLVGEAYALFYLGVYTGDSIVRRYENLIRAEKIALDVKNYALLSQIYNSLGICEMAGFKRYDLAHRAFVNSIKYANLAADPELAIKAESNLSDAFRLVGDTLGIVYDKAIFNYAVRHNNHDMLIASAFHCGMHYARHSRNFSEVKRYLDVLDSIDGYRHYSDYIQALWHVNNNNLSKAYSCIEAAGAKMPDSHSIALLKAEILNKSGRYSSSDSALRGLLTKEDLEKTDNRWIEIYRLSGNNALAQGNYERSAKDLWKYSCLRDSIAKVINDASIAHYKMVYEVEKKNVEITKERAKQRMMTVMICVAGVIACLVIGFLIWHNRRKERLYRAIVKQNKGFSEREKFFEQRISELVEEVASCKSKEGKESKSEIKANTFRMLWQKILYEMEERKVYKDRNLSRDSMAESLGTNHYYLTEVVKENTGLTFPQFVNGYRVREAAHMLEDKNNHKDLKEIAFELGFLSASALNTSFSKTFGMSPGVYRKVARKDSAEKDDGTGTNPDATTA